MTDEPHAPEVPQEQPLSPDMEQAYRKLSRRAVIFTAVVVVAVLVAAGFIGTKSIARRFEGAREIDRAVTLLEDADEVVLQIDEVVRSELSTQVASSARELANKLTATRKDLRESARLIADSMDKVTDDEQERAQLLRASALARIEMLEPAEEILGANVKAALALAPSREGWTLVLAGEKLADESARAYNKLDEAGVKRSNKLAAQAEARLRSADSQFAEAATAFPEAGFDRYREFIAAKIALLELSKRSNDAWLKGDVLASNRAVRSYNAKEKEVLALVGELPETPGKAVADAYGELAGKATTLYEAARKKATEADAKLDAF